MAASGSAFAAGGITSRKRKPSSGEKKRLKIAQLKAERFRLLLAKMPTSQQSRIQAMKKRGTLVVLSDIREVPVVEGEPGGTRTAASYPPRDSSGGSRIVGCCLPRRHVVVVALAPDPIGNDIEDRMAPADGLQPLAIARAIRLSSFGGILLHRHSA